MTQSHSCQTCIFSKTVLEQKKIQRICRRNPPSTSVLALPVIVEGFDKNGKMVKQQQTSIQNLTSWAVVADADWCGEYEYKEPLKAINS